MPMNESKLESVLARAVIIGCGGCVIPYYFLFRWMGVHFQQWHLYVIVTIFLLLISVVDAARKAIHKGNITAKVIDSSFSTMNWFAIGASFLIGSILSMGLVLTYLLFIRGI